MKYIRILINLLAVALFLALAPAALASTWYVDGVNGNDQNNCKSWKHACQTIGHAISLASLGDTIKVAPATYTENLTIRAILTILGADASTTIVDGAGANTVAVEGYVTLSKLTIRNGSALNGGGIVNYGTLTIDHSTISGNSATYGGSGIENYGTLTINHSTISGNNVSWQYGTGGAIENWATLTVNKSTVSGNSAYYGGGIFSGCCNSPVTTINDSTISGNSAGGGGGGGVLLIDGTATINNSTISGNNATGDGGGIENHGTVTINSSTISGNTAAAGGGIWQMGSYVGPVVLQNSIVANNSGGNCLGSGITSDGYNLSDDSTCNFNGPGDMNDTKAKLAALGNYGGPTQTIKEFPHSPTVDAGNPSGCTDGNGNPLTTDQRGDARPGKYKTHKICDMGAYERQTD